MGRTIVVAAAVLALAAPAAHPAARGFKGTVTVTYTLKPEPIVVEGPPATHDGAGSFHGVYTVSGGRFRAKGFPPNAYLLGGSGTENLDVHRHDTEGVSDLTFTATASGTVRLIRRPNGPTETSPLLLILKPHNRFTLGLEAGLDQAGNAGLPLTYKLQRVDTQPCLGAQGNKIRTAIYEQGQLTTTTQVCPGEAPIPTQTEGTPQTESIWGANVWASHAQRLRPNLCRKRLELHNTLLICGRVKSGRMHGTVDILPKKRFWALGDGICPFQPWGIGSLPDPSDDASGDACMNLDLSDSEWIAQLTVTYDLRPL